MIERRQKSGCDFLDQYHLSSGTSGYYLRNDGIEHYDKDIADLCVYQCPYPECKSKEFDDRKERRKVRV